MGLRAVHGLAATALTVLPFVNAQQPGTSTPEVHPQLATWKCTTSGGCTQQNTSVVLDWNYRWIHTASSDSCTTATGVSSTLCPDQATCSKNCLIEGADYATSGVSTSGDALTLKQFVQGANNATNSASPRVYLLGSEGNYEMLSLLGQELTFDVDLSTLPCGENGALYLSEMDPTGGRNADNKGGANYGAGYCDAQCPVQNWANGTLNTAKIGSCCNEMDILEANSRANAFTPHPCGNATSCDKSGCGYNPYGLGYKDYYGPGGTVDTSKPFTVTTQFITDSNSTTGSLSKIVRSYIQGGKTIASAATGGDITTAEGCKSAADYGGMKEMGEALGRGMVLIFSIWNDGGQFMNWLDSGTNGPCNATEGDPTLIQANHIDSHVVFSNIRWGDIGSTTKTAAAASGR